jgi:hypothetical protein
MEKRYAGLSRDVQKALQERGGTVHYHSDTNGIHTGMQQERIGLLRRSVLDPLDSSPTSPLSTR